MENDLKSYIGRTIVVGDARTGKSSVLKRYLENNFDEKNISTIGVDFNLKEKIIDEYKIKLQIWDTAGQERFNSVIEKFYKKSTVIILMYDVSKRYTFKNIEDWVEKIKKVENPGMIYLIGNKIDLVDQREVSFEEGDQFSKRIGARFFETSAKTNESKCVDTMFDAIFADIYNIIKYNPDKIENYHLQRSFKKRGRATFINLNSAPEKVNGKCCLIC